MFCAGDDAFYQFPHDFRFGFGESAGAKEDIAKIVLGQLSKEPAKNLMNTAIAAGGALSKAEPEVMFILSLIVLSVVMIGVQETFPNLLTTGLMTVVIAVAVFNILKESLNKKDETHSK